MNCMNEKIRTLCHCREASPARRGFIYQGKSAPELVIVFLTEGIREALYVISIPMENRSQRNKGSVPMEILEGGCRNHIFSCGL